MILDPIPFGTLIVAVGADCGIAGAEGRGLCWVGGIGPET
jgi:hypothetical protein